MARVRRLFKRARSTLIQKWNSRRGLSGECLPILHPGITSAGIPPYQHVLTYRVLKHAKRPLSTIEAFATEFVPPRDPDKTIDAADISVHAMDVLAEINTQKNPALAKEYLEELAGKYDTMRKGYWAFRIEQLGPAQSPTSGNHK
jgi:hypothetical protein